MNRPPPRQAKHVTHSSEETFALAERLGRAAFPGSCIALTGDLGAGKTVMAKGIAAALNIDPREITSPTFVLMTRHAGDLPLFHCDAYRLDRSAELLILGAEDAFYGEGVSVIEWADRVSDILPPDRLDVAISITGESDRAFHFQSTGPLSRRLMQAATGSPT